MNIAVIPARGGSKRIPRKNIRDFCGQPMIAWPIRAARSSGCFERIIVSTEDEEVAAVARLYGAETPFTRPAELADDHATTLQVMAHAVDAIVSTGGKPAFVCCIYATTPFLAPEDLRAGLDALAGSDADYAVSVARFEAPIQRALRRDANGRVSMMQSDLQSVRSQDLEPAFHDAGQFYWGRSAAWQSRNAIFGSRTIGIELPRERAQDIDTPADWAWCERWFRLASAGPAE